jgi:signal transduction histidine kinase
MAVRLIVGAVILGLAAAALAIPSNMTAFPLVARLAALAVGGAIAGSGMIVWERRPGNPIGPLLVLSGAFWILGRLQGAAWPPLGLAASLGNAFSQTILVAVLVAFPSGRIPSRVGWAIVGFAGVAIVGLSVSALITTEFRDTPAIRGPNPLYIPLDQAVRSILRGAFTYATYLASILALGWLVVRWWRASGPARRSYTPVFVAGTVIGAVTLVGEALVNSGTLSTTQFQLVVSIQILSFALFPAAILVGVLRDRMARGAVADIVVELGDTPAPERMRDALAGALGDPTLEVVYWSPAYSVYTDVSGVPVDPATDAGARAVTLLERDGRPLAAILHDPALADDPGLVAAVAAAVRLAVDNERLTAEVRTQLAEVQASRARIVEASDAERRRVERDLHDGAQQRLVALSLALRRAQAQLPDDAAPELSETLAAASDQLKNALAELRDLARGIHPAILTEAGLGPALRSLARESTVPVDVHLALAAEPQAPVAAAAYFVAAEALTNVAKYSGASHVALTAETNDGQLRVEVADDGDGGADPSAGSGLRGLDDRVAALGGRLDVSSPRGGGTRVVALLPLVPGPMGVI